jgi:hypothetical protein
MSRTLRTLSLFLLMAIQGTLYAQDSSMQTRINPAGNPSSKEAGQPSTKPTSPTGPTVNSPGNSSTASTTPISASVSTQPSTKVDPRDSECWVYAAQFSFRKLAFEVSLLSTYKVQNPCDESSYAKLSEASISAHLATLGPRTRIAKGGIHYNLMSVNLTPVAQPYYDVGNLKFQEQWSATIPLIDIITKKFPSFDSILVNPYIPYPVRSSIYFIWDTGDLAHFLVSPKGQRYIMFSYNNEVSPRLRKDNLTDLKTLLALPTGWGYESALLSKNVTVRASGGESFSMQILFDELRNYYIAYDDN